MSKKHSMPTDPRFKDLTKKKFGRWRVLEYVGKKRSGHYWKCRCSCKDKTIKKVAGKSLGKDSASCGCLLIENKTKHGMANMSEYHIWTGMKQRCSNKNNKDWSDYGGRGIRVCKRWRNSFEKFLKDMGPRPSLMHSLDRFPDNDGNYESGNCRWATRKQQSYNKRNNVLMLYKGKTKPLAYWAKKHDMGWCTLKHRLNWGWSIHKALTTPVQQGHAK